MKLLALIVATFPLIGHAESATSQSKLPIYFARYNDTTVCTDKDDFHRPWIGNSPPASCHFVKFQSRLTTDGSEKNELTDILRIVRIGGDSKTTEAFVKRGDVQIAPESPMDAFAASCTQDGGGGEVQRVVTDAQGRVYIKRYMLTSECHDGKLMQRTRPLN